MADDLLPLNPCGQVKRYPTVRPRPRALTPEQVETIRAGLPGPRDRALWGLVAYAGLRTEEALALRWEDIRPHTGLVAPSQAGGHLDLGNWRSRVFKPAAAAAGIEAKPYDGRASYASLLIHAGRSPLAVAASLGHASAETTWKHYAHLFEEARLASSVEPEEAIRAARRRVRDGSTVRPECDEAPPATRLLKR